RVTTTIPAPTTSACRRSAVRTRPIPWPATTATPARPAIGARAGYASGVRRRRATITTFAPTTAATRPPAASMLPIPRPATPAIPPRPATRARVDPAPGARRLRATTTTPAPTTAASRRAAARTRPTPRPATTATRARPPTPARAGYASGVRRVRATT